MRAVQNFVGRNWRDMQLNSKNGKCNNDKYGMIRDLIANTEYKEQQGLIYSRRLYYWIRAILINIFIKTTHYKE